jgi:hypothetical protein
MGDTENKDFPSRWKIFLLGFFHILWAIVCGVLIYLNWPTNNTGTPMNDQDTILLVVLAGAAGSFIHSAGSFINFVGEKKLSENWIWWYVLRPLVGMGVALVFFIVFKAGLLAGSNTEINPYGLIALSALAGMFSDRATLKLQEIFETLFRPNDQRKGKLSNGENPDSDFENPSARG